MTGEGEVMAGVEDRAGAEAEEEMEEEEETAREEGLRDPGGAE